MVTRLLMEVETNPRTQDCLAVSSAPAPLDETYFGSAELWIRLPNLKDECECTDD